MHLKLQTKKGYLKKLNRFLFIVTCLVVWCMWYTMHTLHIKACSEEGIYKKKEESLCRWLGRDLIFSYFFFLVGGVCFLSFFS